MSALGDYIHYNANNYRTKGVARPDEEGSNFYGGNAYDVVFNNRVAVMQDINGDILNELKRRLRFQSVNQNEEDQAILEQKRNSLTDALINDMLKTYGAGIVGQYQNTTSESSIFHGSQKFAKADVLKSRGKALYSQYDQLLNQIEAQKGRVTNQTLASLNIVLEEMENLTNETDAKSIIGAFNEFEQNHAYSKAYALALGDFGEQLVAATSDNIVNLVGEEAVKAIKQSGIIKGKEKGEFSLNKDSLSKEYITAEAQNVMCKAYSTYNKTDVEVTIFGETLNASVKYYSDTKPTLQRDMNLVASLAYLNTIYEDFGNH